MDLFPPASASLDTYSQPYYNVYYKEMKLLSRQKEGKIKNMDQLRQLMPTKL